MPNILKGNIDDKVDYYHHFYFAVQNHKQIIERAYNKVIKWRDQQKRQTRAR